MASPPGIQTKLAEKTGGEPDPGQKYAPLAPPQAIEPEVTARSIIFGLIINILSSMAVAYLALKVGQGFETAIPISILAVGASGFLLRLGLRRTTIIANVNILAISTTSGMVAGGTVFTMPAIYLLGLQDKLHLGNPTIFLHIFLIPLFGAILGVIFLAPLRRYFVKEMHGKLPFPEAMATNEILVSGQTAGTHAFVLVYSFIVAALYTVCAGALRLWSETFATGKLDVSWAEKATAGDKAGQWVGRSIATLALPGTPADWWYTLTVKFKAIIAMGTGAEFLGLGFIIGIRYASIMVAGSMLSFLVIVPLLSQLDLGALQQINRTISSTEATAIFNNIPKNIGVGCIFVAGLLSILKLSKVTATAWRHALRGFFRKRIGPREVDRTDESIRSPVLGFLGLVTTAALAAYFYVFVFQSMPDGAWLTAASVVLALAVSLAFITASAWSTATASSAPISGMAVTAIIIVPVALRAVGLNAGPGGQLAVLLVSGVAASAISIGGTLVTELRLGQGVAASPKRIQWSCILGCAVASAVVAGTIMLLARTAGFDAAVPRALPAPQANLTKSALEAVLGAGHVPWPAYGVGAVLALLLELAGISPLALGLGMYLPMSLTLPILIGAAIAAAVKSGTRDEATRRARSYKGMVIACGFIAGAALTGVISLGLRGWPKAVNVLNQLDVPGALIRSGHDPEKVGQLFNWFGLIAFVLLGLFILLDSRRARPGAIETR